MDRKLKDADRLTETEKRAFDNVAEGADSRAGVEQNAEAQRAAPGQGSDKKEPEQPSRTPPPPEAPKQGPGVRGTGPGMDGSHPAEEGGRVDEIRES